MSSLSAVAFDLFRYLVVSRVNTGDRFLDSLFITAISLCVTFLSNWILTLSTLGLLSIVQLCYKYAGHGNGILSPLELKLYLYSKNPILTSTYTPTSDAEIMAIFQWVATKYPQSAIADIVSKNENGMDEQFKHQLMALCNSIPIFKYDGDLLYLCYCKEKKELTLRSNRDKTWTEFLKELPGAVKSNDLLIYEVSLLQKETDTLTLKMVNKIPPQKTFDCIISRHKARILSYLNRFVQGNLYDVDSSWICNNLGILLHGSVGGCGKATVIKAICNYTRRHAIRVDMRQLQTAEQLESIFLKYATKEYVLILDGIDFMKNVLTSKSGAIVDNNTLKLRLLQEIANCATQTTRKQLTSELAKLDDQKALDINLLIQLLDEMSESHDSLIIATASFPELVDKALLRPGRFDLKIELTPFNSDEITELLIKMLSPNERDLEYLRTISFTDGVWTARHIIKLVLREDKQLNRIIEALQLEMPEKN